MSCALCHDTRRVFAAPPDDAERPWRSLRCARWRLCPVCAHAAAFPAFDRPADHAPYDRRAWMLAALLILCVLAAAEYFR